MFKVLEGATAPTRATKYSAMVDLCANADVVIGAGETAIIPLGVIIDLDKLSEKYFKKNKQVSKVLESRYSVKFRKFMSTHFLELHPRSSLRAKGLIIGVGVIDLDYPDELGLIVHNPFNRINTALGMCGEMIWDATKKHTIKKGDKIAQCTLVEHKGWLMGIESEIERTGGFGSTDK